MKTIQCVIYKVVPSEDYELGYWTIVPEEEGEKREEFYQEMKGLNR